MSHLLPVISYSIIFSHQLPAFGKKWDHHSSAKHAGDTGTFPPWSKSRTHKKERKRTQMLSNRDLTCWYIFGIFLVHFSAQLCLTTCAWGLDWRNWTSKFETIVHAGKNGYKQRRVTGELSTVNDQSYSTLVPGRFFFLDRLFFLRLACQWGKIFSWSAPDLPRNWRNSAT